MPTVDPAASLRRGFSTLETVIALAMFLVIAFGLASASVSIAATVARTELRAGVVREVDARLAEFASQPYESLLANTAPVPDGCAATTSAPGASSGTVEAAQRSCFRLGAREYALSYAVTAEPDGTLTVTGRSAYEDPAGTSPGIDTATVTRTRTVAPPANVGGDALVRVSYAGSPAAEGLPVVLVDRDGAAAGPAVRFVNGVALARASGDTCVAKGPCRVALGTGAGWAESGGFVLSPADIVGAPSRLVLRAGQVAETAISPGQKGSAVVNVLAQAPGGGSPRTGAAPGSVCVWSTIDTPAGDLSAPFCNTAGSSVTIDGFVAAGVKYPLKDGTRFALTVDRPDGACPEPGSVPGLETLVGSRPETATGWGPAAVCTSWTWGVPTAFASAGSNPVPFDPTSLRTAPTAQVSANAGAYSLIWAATDTSGAVVGRPAAGNGTVGLWEKPRAVAAVGNCVNTSSCLSVALPTSSSMVPAPELKPGRPGSCTTDPFCLSATNVAPGLEFPGGDRAVYAPSGEGTDFDVVAVDAEGSAVTVDFTGGPVYGALELVSGFDLLPVPARLTSSAGPVAATLRYTPSVARPEGTLDTVTVRLTDADGNTRDDTIYLYGRTLPLRVAVSDVTALQDGTADLALTVTDTSGALTAGARVTVAITGGARAPQLSVNEVLVTGADGVATLRGVAVGAAQAGTYGISASLGNGAPPALATLTVLAQVRTLARTPTGTLTGAQGSTQTVVLSATDRAGLPMPGVPVQLYASGEDLKDTRPALASGGTDIGTVPCVTGLDGRCSTGLVIGAKVRKGSESLRLTTPGPPQVVVNNVPLTVTPTLSSLQLSGQTKGATGRLTVAQSAQTRFVVSAVDGSGLDAIGGVVLDATFPNGRPTGVNLVSASQTTATVAGGGLTIGEAAFTVTAGPSARVGTTTVRVTGGTTSVDVEVTITPTLATLSAPAVTVAAGGSTSATVTARDTTSVAMTAAVIETAFPSGSPLRAVPFVVTGASGTAAVPLTVPVGTAPGTYNFTLKGRTGTPSTTVAVTVTSSAYTVSAPSSLIGLRQGAEGSWQLSARRADGTGVSGVTLTPSCSGCGLTFSAAPTRADGITVVTVTASPTAATGTVPVSVLAADGTRYILALYVEGGGR
jgi:hypothetical protein